jgi:hypothetical protein
MWPQREGLLEEVAGPGMVIRSLPGRGSCMRQLRSSINSLPICRNGGHAKIMVTK